MDELIERGQWVTASCRYSPSMKYLIPGFSGVVRDIRPEKDEVDIIEFGSHGTRTARLKGTRAMRGRSKQMEKHIDEIQKIPTFRSPGNRDFQPTEDASSVSLGELVVDRYITNLMRRKESKTMAKKTPNTVQNTPLAEPTTKAPRKSSRKAVSLEGVSPEDFFVENAKGKSVFRPGWDAKFAACLKRVANGTASADDRRLAKSKTLLNHPKVAESVHFQHLIEESSKAA